MQAAKAEDLGDLNLMERGMQQWNCLWTQATTGTYLSGVLAVIVPPGHFSATDQNYHIAFQLNWPLS